jgi:hypothetical protein
MAKAAGKGLKFQFKPLVDLVGVKELVDQVGLERVLAEVMSDKGSKRRLLSHLLDSLSATDRAELKQRLDAKER